MANLDHVGYKAVIGDQTTEIYLLRSQLHQAQTELEAVKAQVAEATADVEPSAAIDAKTVKAVSKAA